MRARPIGDLDHLRDAVTMLDAAFPLWSERTGRDFDYFARRLPSDGSLYVALEDAAGTIGVALPTLAQDVVVLDTEFVAPSADSPSARAVVANAISAAALAMNATRMAVPAGSQLAETYEEMGFLDAAGVPYLPAASDTPLGADQLAAVGKNFTVLVDRWKPRK